MKPYLIILSVLCFCSCKKYLNEKPDQSLKIPSSLKDAQGLLDRNNVLNTVYPYIGEGSADDYYLTDVDFASLTLDNHKSNYTWGDELFFNTYPNDWSTLYSGVYITQLVVETLNTITKNITNEAEYNDIKGQALFHRARLYSIACNLWAKGFNATKAAQTPGIPLRNTLDFNEASVRANLKECYDRITKDLLEAIPLLQTTPVHPMRGSKPAAFALLSRICLSISDFTKAKSYADSCLLLKNDLLDFNSLNAAAAFPIAAYSKEVLFVSYYSAPSHLSNTRAFIDSNLMASYATNDLRKSLFFKDNGNKRFSFKGSYNGNANVFTGYTTAEVILNRAECFARAGDVASAMNDLNTLLLKRYKTGTFIPLKAATADQALSTIFNERRKELVMKDVRWMDLKRLNLEQNFQVTLKRKLNGQIIELPPNSPRYALPIPEVIISMTGMQQNER
jgi:hypothetical protein